MGDQLSAQLPVVVDLAETVGAMQLARRGSVVATEAKAHANDLVSEVDRASERMIVDALVAAFPDDGLLGEEGASRTGSSGRRWVIDPLDGTRDYLSGCGQWAVSIGLEDADGTPLLGVVHDPVNRETFTGVRGGGAHLNGAPIAASTQGDLGSSLIGFCYSTAPEWKRRMAPVLGGLLTVVGDQRKVPAALHLAYQAAGRMEGGLTMGTALWDVAAGWLIAAEAGVRVAATGPDVVVTGCPAVWPSLVAALESVGVDVPTSGGCEMSVG
ncbi:inositol monophosphatase family protein [Actinokineospora sp. G85]|uniref:inositol monophosphatase family protein n=1 Tax=Actinokineospora sp. G85 TaxID=3406626 RepID=UPI003C761AAE